MPRSKPDNSREIFRAQARWPERTRQHVWLSLVAFDVAVLAGHLLSIRVDTNLFQGGHELARIHVLDLRLAHIVWVVALLGGAVLSRHRIGVAGLRWILALQVVPLALIVWIAQATYVETGHPFLPFSGIKGVTVLVAVMDLGAAWMNLLLVVPFWIEAVVAWNHFGEAASPRMAQVGEPQLTIFFVVLGLVLLVFQSVYQSTNRRLFVAESEAAANEQIADVFLSVRDRANTPLQIMELNLVLLQQGDADPEAIPRLRRALDQLKQLHRDFELADAGSRIKVGG